MKKKIIVWLIKMRKITNKEHIIRWAIKRWLPSYHLHLNPLRQFITCRFYSKTTDFISPVPEFTSDGLTRPASEEKENQINVTPQAGERRIK